MLAALNPVMKVADKTLGSRPAKAITVATMEGTGEGLNDLHYGNEVLLQRPRYAVTVEVARDRAGAAVPPFQVR